MSIATLTIDINAKLASLERDIGKAAHIAEQNAKKMEAAFSAVGKTIATLGAALSVGAFANMVKGVADAGDQLAKMSTRTGIAVEELSKLQYAASLSDVSNEDLASSLGRLNKVLGEAADGSKEATAALARFGIAPGSMDALEAFNQIADRVKNTGDQTKIASAMNDIFGKSWASLVPMIKDGSSGLKSAGDELERFGGVMSSDLAKASERFNDNLTKINASLDVLKISASGPVISSLETLTGKMVEATKAAGGFWTGLATWGTTSGKQEGDTGKAIAEIVGKLNTLKEMKAGLEAPTLANKLGFNNEDIAIVNKQISVLTTQLEYLKGLNTSQTGDVKDRWLPSVSSSSGITATPEKEKKKKQDDYTDPMTASAQALAKAIADIDSAQQNALKSTLDLSVAEQVLYDLQTSAMWADMPESWKQMVEQRAAAAIATEKLTAEQAKLNDILAALPSSKIEETWDKVGLLGRALEAGKISAEKYQEAINQLFGEETTAKIKKQKSLAEELGMTFSSAFEDAIVKGEEFSKILEGIAQNILRIMVRRNITEPLTNALGTLFKTNADGGVYSSPGLSQYSGSVVSKPTFFPFAKGVGLMGEAGAEAILPLKRGSSGALGVQADGLGSNVQVIINNNASNTQATQTTRDDGNGGTIIEVMIEQINSRISSDIQRGNGVVPAAMERTYGLNRSAGAY